MTASHGETAGTLPRYDELPVRAGAPPGSSWGLWGDDDRLGCLNLLTPQRVAAAAHAVVDGDVVPLSLAADLPHPPLFGRPPLRHRVIGDEEQLGRDDVLDGWNTQSSTQWDGFRHIRHPVHGFYNGLPGTAHGTDHWAERGIVGRGLLVDVGRHREAQGRPLRFDEPDAITVSDLTGCLDDLAAHGTGVQPGDILLLRTGWTAWYRALDTDARAALAADLVCPGLQPSDDMCALLWNSHIAALAADNPSVERWPLAGLPDAGQRIAADPGRAQDVFLHTALLPLLGLPLGELFDLEPLAAVCAADGRHTCLFVSAPLPVPGGVASPPGAVAIR